MVDTATLEEIQPGARVIGLDPAHTAEIVSVAAFGPDAVNVVFRANGKVAERLVFREEASHALPAEVWQDLRV